MFLRRIVENLRVQNWTAIGLDFLIVVVGVFIGTQVSNWNEGRKEKAASERLLGQLVPEIRGQLSFFDGSRKYYATTRHYADVAFAGWQRDPRVNDEQFVIAAYQASQINSLGINPDSWSLTFGGEQLRNIDNPELRRALEVVLTSDYAPVLLPAVSTAYREQVRRVIPTDIQEAIRGKCGDRNVSGKASAIIFFLPATCSLSLDPRAASRTAAALRARPDLVEELNWHLAAVATYQANADILEQPMRELYQQLTSDL